MESLKNESSWLSEQMVVNSNNVPVVDFEEMCPKRICVSVSNHTGTVNTPVTFAAECSEMATENSTLKLSTDCQDSSSGAPFFSSEVSVADDCRQSEQLSRKASSSEVDIGHNEIFSANCSDADISRRRNLRRKLILDC